MSLAARALLALGTALALIGGGYWWGHTATDNAWTARQAKAEKAAADALAQEAARADEAAATYLTNHLDQEDRYATLDAAYRELRRRTPLVVERAAAAYGLTALLQQSPVPAVAGPVESPGITLAAVRMWNGALTGLDAPAGACGAAGAAFGPDAACIEDSGLTLDDAWANHAANARSCAADRQRYRALIDFLQQQPQGEGASWPSKKTN